MRNLKINKQMPARRSIEAISLRNFRSVKFDHKTEEQGGAVNESRDLLEEALEDHQDWEQG